MYSLYLRALRVLFFAFLIAATLINSRITALNNLVARNVEPTLFNASNRAISWDFLPERKVFYFILNRLKGNRLIAADREFLPDLYLRHLQHSMQVNYNEQLPKISARQAKSLTDRTLLTLPGALFPDSRRRQYHFIDIEQKEHSSFVQLRFDLDYFILPTTAVGELLGE